MRIQEENIDSQKKLYRRISVEHHFLAAHRPSHLIFCRFFLPTPSFLSTPKKFKVLDHAIYNSPGEIFKTFYMLSSMMFNNVKRFLFKVPT